MENAWISLLSSQGFFLRQVDLAVCASVIQLTMRASNLVVRPLMLGGIFVAVLIVTWVHSNDFVRSTVPRPVLLREEAASAAANYTRAVNHPVDSAEFTIRKQEGSSLPSRTKRYHLSCSVHDDRRNVFYVESSLH